MADGLVVRSYVVLAERPVHRLMLVLNGARLISRLPRAVLGSGRRTTVEGASREVVAHSVSVLRNGRRLDSRLIEGRGDFRMAAASAVVSGEALLGRDGAAAAKPGAWCPEDLLSLGRVGVALRRAGVEVTGASRTESGALRAH